VSRDRIEAVSWFDRACEGGSGRGCELAGWVRYNGHGVALDVPAAARLYARACESGRCFLHALRLRAGGHGTRRDPEGALAALRTGCEAGEAESCGQLWHDVYNRPVPHEVSRVLGDDGARAFELALTGCTDWDPDACGVYALMTDGGMEHLALKRPTRLRAAARMCGQGWARGCQLGGDQEKACEMGIRWLCDNIAEEGIEVTYPGIRP
jgi:TPR repeat protein